MDDTSIVKIMQSLDLDYSKAILSTKHFENSILALNQQLSGMKAIAQQAAKDINATFAQQLGSVPGNNTILDQFGKPLVTVQTEAKKAGSGIVQNLAPATEEMKKHGQAVQDVAKQYDVFGSEMQRRTSWFMSGTIFYGGIKAAKEAISTISEVEMGMVEIARVMEDSTFSFKDYRDELMQLGIDYGFTFDTVQDIALRWAQAGYNVADSLKLTRTSLLALNTAELDAANATESMVGIMAQWGLEADDLLLVIDKINKTADDYTVTSQDLVDGLLRSSSAARIMNLSLDETVALLTVMRETSGRTGREVGNALNSILSYIQRPGSISVLESMGIQVFADEAKTEFRNVMGIFEDVAAKWNTTSDAIKDGFVAAADDAGLFNEELATALGLQEQWNDLQQRDIAQASAGVYRRNYYIGMIERLSTAQEVLNGITEAAGYSQEENSRTMDTLAKKYESLKAAAETLAVAIGDAGLLDALKGLLDIGTGAIQLFNRLPEPIKDLAANFIVVTAAIQGFKAASKMLGFDSIIKSITNAVKAQNSLNKAIDVGAISMEEAAIIQKAWKAGTQATTLSTNAAAVQTELFGIAMQGTTIKAAALQAVLGFGIPLAISAVITLFTNFAQAQEEAKQRADELVSRLQQERRELNDLKAEYTNIIEAGNLTEESKQRLKTIQDKLIETFGLEAAGLDLVNGKYEEQIGLIDEAAAKKAQSELAALGSAPDKARAALQETGIGAVKVPGYDKELEAIVQSLGANLIGPKTALAKALMSDDQFYIKITGTVEERRDSLNKLILALREMPNKSEDISRTIDALSAEFTKLEEFIRKNKDVLNKEKQAIDIIETFTNPAVEPGNDNPSNGTDDPVTKAKKALETLKEKGLDSESIITGYKNTLRSLLNANKISLKTYYNELRDIRKEMYSEYINKSAEDLKNLATNSAHAKSVSGYLSLEEEIQNTYKKLNENPNSTKDPTNEALRAELKFLDHKKRIGELSTEQEISSLKRLQGEYSMNADERMNIIERIYSAEETLRRDREKAEKEAAEAKEKAEKEALEQAEARAKELQRLQKDLADEWTKYYKEQLKEQQKSIKDSYDERIKKIKETAEVEKKAHQDRIEQIDDELKAIDRTDEERDYSNRMKELQDELAYWRVRTGREAREKTADLQKQIAEEQHDREIELTKQTLQDEKETLQDKINAIDEATKKEVEKWEAAYEEIEDAFDDHALDIISTAGTMAEGAYDQWVEKYFNPLMKSLSSDVPEAANVRGLLGQKAVTDEAAYQLASSIVDYKRQYEQEGNTFAHEQAKLYYQQLTDIAPAIAAELQKMNYETAKQYIGTLPGLTVSVPNLSGKLDFATPQTTGGSSSNKTEINIGNLLNIENNNMEDDVDGEIVARQIHRTLVNIK